MASNGEFGEVFLSSSRCELGSSVPALVARRARGRALVWSRRANDLIQLGGEVIGPVPSGLLRSVCVTSTSTFMPRSASSLKTVVADQGSFYVFHVGVWAGFRCDHNFSYSSA